MPENNDRKENPHRGSSFDDFLDEEGIRDESERVAKERVAAWQERVARGDDPRTEQIRQEVEEMWPQLENGMRYLMRSSDFDEFRDAVEKPPEPSDALRETLRKRDPWEDEGE